MVQWIPSDSEMAKYTGGRGSLNLTMDSTFNIPIRLTGVYTNVTASYSPGAVIFDASGKRIARGGVKQIPTGTWVLLTFDEPVILKPNVQYYIGTTQTSGEASIKYKRVDEGKIVPHKLPHGVVLTQGLKEARGGVYQGATAEVVTSLTQIFGLEYTSVVAPDKPLTCKTATKATVGSKLEVTYDAVPTPVQYEGVTLDTSIVYYELSLYNGKEWLPETVVTVGTTPKITIPAMEDTTNAKVRLRTYVLYGGEKIYSNYGDGDAQYVVSSPFTIVNNTAPTTSTDIRISVPSGSTIKALEKVTVQFKLGTDVDVADVLSGVLDYWNGSEWLRLSDSLKPTSERQVSFTHFVPAKAVTGAKYRVATYDGKELSPYTESYTFNVTTPDQDKQYPNALYFDGIDDYVVIEGTWLIQDSWDFTVEGFFKTKRKVETPQTVVRIFADSLSSAKVVFYLGSTGHPVLEVYGSGSSTVPESAKDYRDGVLHHYAIVKKGTSYTIYIDGEVTATLTGSITLGTKQYIVLGRFSEEDGRYFEGTLGLPRIWNDVRTVGEMHEGKNKVYPDDEQGLHDYFIFEPTTGKLVGKKNRSFIGTFYNGVEWVYRFSPMLGIKLPYASSAQMKENLDYLRVQVNEFRKANGLPLISWTDTTLVRSLTPIKAVHINELENGVDETYKLTGQVILNQTVKRIIEETVLPKDNRFLVNNMISRFDAIVKALMNES